MRTYMRGDTEEMVEIAPSCFINRKAGEHLHLIKRKRVERPKETRSAPKERRVRSKRNLTLAVDATPSVVPPMTEAPASSKDPCVELASYYDQQAEKETVHDERITVRVVLRDPTTRAR